MLPPAPPAPRGRAIDTLHGEVIVDPYRPLEDGAAAVTRAWSEAQNVRTRQVLDDLPDHRAIQSRLAELMSVGLLGVPRPFEARIFFTARRADERQSVLHVRTGPVDRALVDPNTMDARGLVSLDWWYPSGDGTTVAYGLSRGGDEQSTLHLIRVETGGVVDAPIPHTPRAQVAWVPGGFYYTVNPVPGTVPPGDEHYHRRIRYHRLGTDPADDPLVFGEGRPKDEILSADTDPGGRWVLFSAHRGWVSNDLYLLDRTADDGPRTVLEGADALATGTILNGRVWLRTNLDSPNYRIVAVDPAAPDRARWRTVVPESDHVIESFAVTRRHLIVHTLERATSRLTVWGQDGQRIRAVPLPGSVTITGPVAEPDGERFGFTVESFARPAIAQVAAAEEGDPTTVAALPAPVGLDPDTIVVEQERYRSRDGTVVTMFLIHHRDTRPTGAIPTVLTGYGGFNISRTPLYSAGIVLWAERGGLVALPNLRGGGEYGERWHRAGMLAGKQNVFDDFHAAGEALISGGWTTPAHLGCSGGSNGGLLVGAALTQRPDLFAAAVCAVPLLDMLRYQHFLIARFWIAEYGSAEDPLQYRWLRAYSPYHQLRAGVRYPAVLLTTAEGDSRVDPGHARKMGALLQELQSGDPEAVTLVRIDADAGHGVGKPLDLQTRDLADQYAFFGWRLK
ncbi:MAG TPA: prolyl oligopeptidase family serine peptidase [Candidatus Limnocylindria bacterium]|jgi:prolyl oligopeptidase